ncbi:hypothetical protein DB30_00317 [Enhygromyxa salina]|uniref:Tetratricopeptide repeat protein n=1 Tax=Enhygromyxa salina TaxID=215803 RepID=A0A0C2DG18_9BACT|nr:hypothetical protein [Enhygromyxa salina]KIG18632.1 hypothetical protein DB30_00317 [Enhygromyxa salina]
MLEQLYRLAYDHLSHPTAYFPPRLSAPRMHDAALALGGLELLGGETLIAVVESSDPPAASFSGLWITDRRIMATEPLSSIPLTMLEDARGGVRAPRSLEIATPQGAVHIELDAAQAVAAFVRAVIGEIPLEARKPIERPLCVPQQGDPLGVVPYCAGHLDPRVVTLFGLGSILALRDQQGREQGQELAWRGAVLQRTLDWGRAIIQGVGGWAWLGLVPRQDFASMLIAILGTPQQQWTDPNGSWGYDFLIPAERARWLEATAGVRDWVLDAALSLRVVCWDHAWMTTFTLEPSVELPPSRARAVRAWAHAVLVAYEARAILLRALDGGWQTSMDRLLLRDPSQVLAHLEADLGSVDISAFYPAQDPATMVAIDDRTAAILAEVEATPLDEMTRRARAAWEDARCGGQAEAMLEAALGLQHVNAWSESIAAYGAVLELHPEQRTEALQGIGDNHLFLFELGPALGLRIDARAELEAALAAYEAALADPDPYVPGLVEHNYWEATCGLAERLDADARGEVLRRYIERFPTGEHRPDANRLLASL